MKKKVGTILDETLLYKARQAALIRKESFSKLIEDALEIYLLTLEKKRTKSRRNISRETQGVMKINPDILKAVMEDEGIYES